MIRGQGLHTGAPARVRFERADGPIVFVQNDTSVPLSELDVVDATRSTTLGKGALRVRTVEHVLAAVAGLGLYEGVRIIVEGPEMPLADGCAAAFFAALSRIGAQPSRVPLVVTRRAEIAVGESRYVFEPHDGVALEVQVDYGDARIANTAKWDGNAQDFGLRIAVARTFGFAHEVEALAERGLASHVSPESVVVFARDAVLFSGRPYLADEPARHKLLDLAGDLFVHGGPPLGRVIAHRPGHAATHAAFAQARSMGVVSPRS
jgi:UDP-3-O-[3-hydroxymyristoyl] N-acetylglucosamine deacetylase